MAASNHIGQAIRVPDYLATATLDLYADTFRAVNDHLGGTPGRRDSKSLVVTAAGGMNISIGVGTAMVQGTDRGGNDASGITSQGSYIARVDSAITPVHITGAGTWKVYLVVGDKTENSANFDDAYVVVLASTAAVPKSSLVLATVTVPTGSAAVTSTMISMGARSQHPALVDTNYGYVDNKTAMTNTQTPIEPKAFRMIGNGDAPIQGTNVRGITTAGTWTLNDRTWTCPPWNNSATAYGGHLDDCLYSDSGSLYVGGDYLHRGFVPNASGIWRVSASFAFGHTGTTAKPTYVGRRFIQILTVGGRKIGGIEASGAELGDQCLSVSVPFVWWIGNNPDDPVRVMLYQDAGAAMTMPAPYIYPDYYDQSAFLERIA